MLGVNRTLTAKTTERDRLQTTQKRFTGDCMVQNQRRERKTKFRIIIEQQNDKITETLSSDIHTGSSRCFLISSLTREYQLSMEPAGITAKREIERKSSI